MGSKDVAIQISGDDDAENDQSDEGFTVTCSNTTNDDSAISITLLPTDPAYLATGTILNDDVLLSIAASDNVDTNEGDSASDAFTFEVTLIGDTSTIDPDAESYVKWEVTRSRG